MKPNILISINNHETPTETWVLLGFASLYPTYIALFIANIWGELNFAIRTPICCQCLV
ncbi:MAG: hypothetical protein RIM23_25765 [Coleofasciculus sp. G3-WIS-01]|uniref:hypothetical protein n=1 Tax=Coleofasciculus sp. G3-WIS-01 TaxID=3069528 RepID=UPI003304C457